MLISIIFLFLAGIFGGFIAGLIGIGGGIVYIFVIPSALQLAGIPNIEIPQYTIANSIFAIMFASASANYSLLKLNNFYLKEILIIGIFASFASLIVLYFVVHTPWYSLELFNLIVILILLYMLYITLLTAKKVYVNPPNSLTNWKLILVGVASGAIAALSGMGGGIVVIPVLNSLLKVDIKKSCSISSGVIMISAFSMTMYNLFGVHVHEYHDFHNFNIGYIIFPVALALTAGVIISSPLGVKASRKISPIHISYIYASLLMIVIFKKIIELYLLEF